MYTNPGMGGVDAAFGIFFGIMAFLYIAVALFVTVLVIVFIFKAMGFMKRKNAMDQQMNQTLREVLHHLAAEEINRGRPKRDSADEGSPRGEAGDGGTGPENTQQ